MEMTTGAGRKREDAEIFSMVPSVFSLTRAAETAVVLWLFI
jgi:hypothetical protein